LTGSMYGAGAEYALHSLLILATQPAPVSVSDLASYQRIPERFLAKIFTRLKTAKLVKGTEGISGGFILAKSAETIHVMEVLSAVDPGRVLFACAEIRQNCTLLAKHLPDGPSLGPAGSMPSWKRPNKSCKAIYPPRPWRTWSVNTPARPPRLLPQQRRGGSWTGKRTGLRTAGSATPLDREARLKGLGLSFC
jgi:Rrf2 family protein